MWVPFIAYADIECITEKIDTCQSNPNQSYTQQYQKHTISGWSYCIKSFDDEIFPPIMRTCTATSDENSDMGADFISSLEADIRMIYETVDFHKPMDEKSFDQEDFENATHSHICEGVLGNDRVKDHDHLTGKYRGAAHNKCNLAFNVPKFIPVVMHNLAGYDAHLFIKRLHTTPGNISCILNNEEKFITFSKRITVGKDEDGKDIRREIRFRGSYKIMSSSLASLVSNLPPESCKNLAMGSPYDAEKFRLMRRKGVFPYNWFYFFDKLKETQLPPKDAFYSKLNDCDITDEDYKHTQNVWETFDMKSMREYHDFYLETDVLLLADVFENFSAVGMKHYGLAPAWCFTAPGLTWDAMLKKTKVKMELITDPTCI